MSALFVLIGFSLAIALVFLIAFLWATRSGQYDDDYTPSVRAVLDDVDWAQNCERPHSSIETSNEA